MILAYQLIVAKLNIANGSNPTPVASTIADADSLLSGFPGKLPYHVKSSSPTGQAMVNDASVLDSYNNGQLTPDCIPYRRTAQLEGAFSPIPTGRAGVDEEDSCHNEEVARERSPEAKPALFRHGELGSPSTS